MSPPAQLTVPAEGFSGQLRESPLFVVLRRIQRERRSGTLSVFRDDSVRQFFFENGELHAARSSQEEHRIGRTLVRWGYIQEHDLEAALQVQEKTHQRIDQVLIQRGVVTRAVIDSEARRQMEQIVFSTLSWTAGSFHFEADTGKVELDVAVSLSQEMIIEGIRRIPESEQFMELLGDLEAVPTLTRDSISSGSLRLLRDAVGVLQQIDGKRSARELLKSSTVSGSASAKILYSLLFAGLIEMRAPGNGQASSGPVSAAGAEPPDGTPETGFRLAPEALPQHGEETIRVRRPSRRPIPMGGTAGDARHVVLETYAQLDWLSHYDLLGVSRKATAGEIEAAFRTRALLFDPTLDSHPELGDCWRQLKILGKWLQVAYDVLSNPATRAEYDASIGGATPAPATASDRTQ